MRATFTTGFATRVGSDVLLGIENLTGTASGDALIDSQSVAKVLKGLGATTC